MIKLEQLYYLQAVARLNSIKLAAEDLSVVPSTISTSLHKLENELGIQLLIRTYKGIELTNAAKEIAIKTNEVFYKMDEIEDIVARYRGENGSNIYNEVFKIYMSRGYYQGNLDNLFRKFKRLGINVDFPDISKGNETYLDFVNQDENSILVNYFVEPACNLINEYKNVEFMRINSSQPVIICCKDGDLIAPNKDEITPEEAIKLPLLMFTEGYDLALPIFEMLEEYGTLNIIGKYNNISVLSAMLSNCKGVSVSNSLGGLNQSLEEEYRIVPIKSDMRISLIICYNKNIVKEKHSILKEIVSIFK